MHTWSRVGPGGIPGGGLRHPLGVSQHTPTLHGRAAGLFGGGGVQAWGPASLRMHGGGDDDGGSQVCASLPYTPSPPKPPVPVPVLTAQHLTR